jgi:hypothetical protein
MSMSLESILQSLLDSSEWREEWLTTMKGESSFLVQSGAHLLPVPRDVDVLRVTHGILVAIHAAYIARDAGGIQFDAHSLVILTVDVPPLTRMKLAATTSPEGRYPPDPAVTFLPPLISRLLLKSYEGDVPAETYKRPPPAGSALTRLSAIACGMS